MHLWIICLISSIGLILRLHGGGDGVEALRALPDDSEVIDQYNIEGWGYCISES